MEATELEARLMALEQARENDLMRATEEAFMNRYGGAISNSRSLGLTIMNELARRGIDIGPASNEVVARIIEQLRGECNAILDATAQAKSFIESLAAQASQKLDEMNATQEAINTAAAATGEAEMPTSEAMAEMQPGAQEQIPTEPMPPEQQMPAEQPSAEIPPEQPSAEQPPVEVPPEQPPAEQPPAEQPPIKPDEVTSDKNAKNIKAPKSYFRNLACAVSDRNMKNVSAPASVGGSGNIASNIINACRGI